MVDDMNLVNAADTALEQRAQIIEQRKAVVADKSLTEAEKRSRVERMDADIDALAKEARDYVQEAEQRAMERRTSLVTTAHHRQQHIGSAPMEWRSLIPSPQEWRALTAEGTPSAGGYAVPQGVSQMYIDKLRAQSVFLKAPGVNSIAFEQATFVIPGLASSSAVGVVAEGVTIPQGTATLNAMTFAPVKYASIYQATSEILDDASVDVEALVANTMIRDTAAQVDKDSFQGAGGATALRGLIDPTNSVTTSFAVGHTAVLWDDIIDATATILATGGHPTVVWCSPDMWKALQKQRTNVGGAGTGEYLAGEVSENPANAAWGLPLLASGSLPSRTVIVADATRVYLGVRKRVRLAKSVEYAFNQDVTSYRLTYRVAGVKSAEPSSVQTLVASAT